VFKYIIETPQIRNLIIANAGGTSGSMLNISKENFLGEEIPLFSPKKQDAFILQHERISSMRSLHISALGKTNELFSSLQHRAFAGEL